MSQTNDFISGLEYLLQRASTPGNDKEIQQLYNLYRQLVALGTSVFRQTAAKSASYPELKKQLQLSQAAFDKKHEGPNLDEILKTIADFKAKHPIKQASKPAPNSEVNTTTSNVPEDNGLDGQDDEFVEPIDDGDEESAPAEQPPTPKKTKVRVVNDGVPQKTGKQSNASSGSIDNELTRTQQALANLVYQAGVGTNKGNGNNGRDGSNEQNNGSSDDVVEEDGSTGEIDVLDDI